MVVFWQYFWEIELSLLLFFFILFSFFVELKPSAISSLCLMVFFSSLLFLNLLEFSFFNLDFLGENFNFLLFNNNYYFFLFNFLFLFLSIYFWQVFFSKQNEKMEFVTLIFFILLLGLVLFKVTNLLESFLIIESLSFIAYILAGFEKDKKVSASVGIQYLIVGSVSSIFLLLAILLIYYQFSTTALLNLVTLNFFDFQKIESSLIDYLFVSDLSSVASLQPSEKVLLNPCEMDHSEIINAFLSPEERERRKGLFEYLVFLIHFPKFALYVHPELFGEYALVQEQGFFSMYIDYQLFITKKARIENQPIFEALKEASACTNFKPGNVVFETMVRELSAFQIELNEKGKLRITDSFWHFYLLEYKVPGLNQQGSAESSIPPLHLLEKYNLVEKFEEFSKCSYFQDKTSLSLMGFFFPKNFKKPDSINISNLNYDDSNGDSDKETLDQLYEHLDLFKEFFESGEVRNEFVENFLKSKNLKWDPVFREVYNCSNGEVMPFDKFKSDFIILPKMFEQDFLPSNLKGLFGGDPSINIIEVEDEDANNDCLSDAETDALDEIIDQLIYQVNTKTPGKPIEKYYIDFNTGDYIFQNYINFLEMPINPNFFFFNLTIVSLGFLVGTLLYKIKGAPFHIWAPTIYTRMPTGSMVALITTFTLIFSLFFFQLFFSIFSVYELIFCQLFSFIGVLSLVFAFMGAFEQKILKRFFVFSSVGHVAFLIFTFISYSSFKNPVVLLSYLVIYLISTFFLWYLITFNTSKIDFLTNLLKNTKSNSFFFLIFVIIIFSMSGIPPLAGFYIKFDVFSLLIANNEFFVLFVSLLITVASFYYYLRLLKIATFENYKPILLNVLPSEKLWLYLKVCFLVLFIPLLVCFVLIFEQSFFYLFSYSNLY